MKNINKFETIVALATPTGKSAIAVIRLSGEDSIPITNKIFSGQNLTEKQTHTLNFGTIIDKKNNEIVDEVLVSIFKKPNSFTRENSIEISCHGSQYIVQRIIKLLLDEGARLAEPGEFTKRSFINGRFDLLQAEAVADIINAENELAHKAAINQMRGGFSSQIRDCRNQIITLASLIELELDFAEEDVIFADRTALIKIINELLSHINKLLESFALDNVIKNGIATAIVGKPNAGKSTLLNALLNEDRAITSSTPGTTRDTLEENFYIKGINFRFIDTAGLRLNPDNEIEAIGIKKTKEQIEKADLILYILDLETENIESIEKIIIENKNIKTTTLYVGNKIDRSNEEIMNYAKKNNFILISALEKQNLNNLEEQLLSYVNQFSPCQNIIINIRHYESLTKSKEALERALKAITTKVPSDLLMQDIRMTLHYLGTITGDISNEDLLDNIFSKFCIGK